MHRLAQFCLIAQIILAPVMLGGARPWAMAILSILTGIGLLAMIAAARNLILRRYVFYVWILVAGLIGWSVLQSMPVWPIQPFPFEAPYIALYPDGWIDLSARLIWLAGTITLGSLIAQLHPGHWQIIVGKAVIASCCLQLILATGNAAFDWQTTFWFVKTAHIGDWTGSFANRNAFGILMATGAMTCLWFFVRYPDQSTGKRLDQSGSYLALAILFTAALIQSHSRSAILAIIIATILFVTLCRSRQSGLARLRRFFAATAGAVIVLALVASAEPELFIRFADLGRLDLIQRDDAWLTAIHAIAERPITGYGANSIRLVMAHVATPDLNTNAHWFSSHNLWLDGAIMFGIPVTMAVALSLIAAIVFMLRHAANRPNRAFGAALISIALIGSFSDWVISLPALILPMVAMWVAGLEGRLASPFELPERADHAEQSPLPDQATLRQ